MVYRSGGAASTVAAGRGSWRAVKHVERAVAALAVLSALFTLAFVAYSYLYSPQNPVSSEIQFEAWRVARKLPLYVDPWKGAWEDGPPPSRYYVLYTPIFPTLVGLLSGHSLESVKTVGRTIAVLSWLGFHVPAVVFAPKERRRVTVLAAMLAGGIYFLARNAASMSPDTLATALVCGGVLRAALADEIDPIAAVLLIAGPFVKPSCLGGVAGAAIALFALRRPGWVRGLLAGLGTFVVIAGLCHLASDGAWLHHITSSTGQPLSLARWLQEMGGRFFLLGLPHAVIAWLAVRRKMSWLVTAPLIGSIAWSTFAMAKHGSGAHYWLEPTGLALIAISRMPERSADAFPASRLWIGALAFAVLSAISSWPHFLAEPARVKKHDEAVAALRARIPDGEYVVATEFELEMTLNHGHISVPSWQSAFLARSGKFPKEEWQQDLVRPEVRWVAIASDPREPPPATNDGQMEQMPYYDLLREPLFSTFEFVGVVGGMFLYERK
jgi:hypothetical protein